MSALKQAVLDRNLDAADIARDLGARALPELRELARHEDAGVRLVAIIAAAEVPDPAATQLLIDAVRDDDPQVATTAVERLERDEARIGFARLLEAFDSTREPDPRRRLVRALGRVGTPPELPQLTRRCAHETNQEVRSACLAARARLGDAEARREFVAALHGGAGRDKLARLQDAEYIGQPWLLAPLGQLLDDREPVQDLPIDNVPGAPRNLRACDVAVRLIGAIGGGRFSFRADQAQNFSEAQLAEVRAFVARAGS